ncbi:hypothetical protein ElyMa_000596700 [Elysia marginata]|uniref:Uncharacterized protein n=1 Tax=Elysia marginata TaxID=1093978 RepID=A0AAV4G7T2_9GAST|nr:hypothetical protein ElyMa_000596700 [Elysia marginata]
MRRQALTIVSVQSGCMESSDHTVYQPRNDFSPGWTLTLTKPHWVGVSGQCKEGRQSETNHTWGQVKASATVPDMIMVIMLVDSDHRHGKV